MKRVRRPLLWRMITVGVIRNGERYLAHHHRKNDYWTEGEKEILGEWIGEGAKALGLAGEVEAKSHRRYWEATIVRIRLLSQLRPLR